MALRLRLGGCSAASLECLKEAAESARLPGEALLVEDFVYLYLKPLWMPYPPGEELREIRVEELEKERGRLVAARVVAVTDRGEYVSTCVEYEMGRVMCYPSQ